MGACGRGTGIGTCDCIDVAGAYGLCGEEFVKLNLEPTIAIYGVIHSKNESMFSCQYKVVCECEGSTPEYLPLLIELRSISCDITNSKLSIAKKLVFYGPGSELALFHRIHYDVIINVEPQNVS